MESPVVPTEFNGVRRRKLDGAGILTAAGIAVAPIAPVFPPHSSATALHRPGAKATHFRESKILSEVEHPHSDTA